MKKIVLALVCTVFAGNTALGTPLGEVVVPRDNPMSPAKVELGKALFFDPILSSDGTVSCNSCHNVFGSGTDNRAASAGVRGQLGGRSAPTVWNAAYQSVMFWDGRAASLEEQALGPITNPVEMGMDHLESAVQRLRSIPEYEQLFTEAFGTQGITPQTIAKAIASFERTLITKDSPYDRFIKGDSKAISTVAKEGHEIFQTTGCIACHSGGNFSGPSLPMGTGFFQKFPTVAGSAYESRYRLTDDLGRFTATKNPADKNFWRVPTLRNIAVSAPYFHNGSVVSLDEAVRVMAKTQLGKDLKNEDVTKIVAFLETLTGEYPEIKGPRLPQLRGRSLYNPKPFSQAPALPQKSAG